jgi:hypothetical protein
MVARRHVRIVGTLASASAAGLLWFCAGSGAQTPTPPPTASPSARTVRAATDPDAIIILTKAGNGCKGDTTRIGTKRRRKVVWEVINACDDNKHSIELFAFKRTTDENGQPVQENPLTEPVLQCKKGKVDDRLSCYVVDKATGVEVKLGGYKFSISVDNQNANDPEIEIQN